MQILRNPFSPSSHLLSTLRSKADRIVNVTETRSIIIERYILSNLKFLLSFTIVTIILGALALPVFAIQYNPGVTVGQYVKYGNFVGSGPGYGSFSEFDFLTLQVESVSGSKVTLLSTGQYSNGTALPGNNTTDTWNLEAGTENGTPSTQGPIIATNLNQGDEIPPQNTFSINQTVSKTYLGVTRSVNILDVTISSPGYNSTLYYVYDKLSGMLLEASSTTSTQADPLPIISAYSYNIIETNIFSSTGPSPTVPEFPSIILLSTLTTILVVTASTIFLIKKKPKINQ